MMGEKNQTQLKGSSLAEWPSLAVDSSQCHIIVVICTQYPHKWDFQRFLLTARVRSLCWVDSATDQTRLSVSKPFHSRFTIPLQGAIDCVLLAGMSCHFRLCLIWSHLTVTLNPVEICCLSWRLQ